MAKCILCNGKAQWSVGVVHDGERSIENFCERCYKAFNYGYRQCIFQNIERFPDVEIEKRREE